MLKVTPVTLVTPISSQKTYIENQPKTSVTSVTIEDNFKSIIILLKVLLSCRIDKKMFFPSIVLFNVGFAILSHFKCITKFIYKSIYYYLYDTNKYFITRKTNYRS